MSLNMKNIVSVDVQESGAAGSFASFWLISKVSLESGPEMYLH